MLQYGITVLQQICTLGLLSNLPMSVNCSPIIIYFLLTFLAVEISSSRIIRNLIVTHCFCLRQLNNFQNGIYRKKLSQMKLKLRVLSNTSNIAYDSLA